MAPTQVSPLPPVDASESADKDAASETANGESGNPVQLVDSGTTEGDAANLPEVQCTEDPDCDDLLVCTGVERCVEGQCVAADQPYCGQLENCVVSCVEADAGATCLVQAEDEDEDGSGTLLCAESPGLDCDDSSNTVGPLSDELCDGVDQNCNGESDLDELGAGGEMKVMRDGGTVIGLWSTPMEGAAILESFRYQTSFYWLDSNGSFSAPVTPQDLEFPSGLSDGHERIALVRTQFQLVDRNGVTQLDPAPVLHSEALDADVVATDAGWLAFYVLSDWPAPLARRLTAEGAFVGQTPASVGIDSNAPSRVRAAMLGDKVGIVWEADDGVFYSQYTEALGKLSSRMLNASGDSIGIAANNNGYGIAWVEEDASIQFVQLDDDGETVCGPNFVGVGMSPGGSSNRLAIAPYGEGYVILFTDQGESKLQLLAIHDECDVQLPPLPFPDDYPSYKSYVHLKGDEGGLLATWAAATAEPRYRTLGPLLCDSPLDE